MLKSEKIKSNLIPTDNSNKKENLFIEKTETLKKQQQKVILSKRDVELKGYNFIRKKISEAYRDKKIYKKLIEYTEFLLDKIIQSDMFPIYRKGKLRKTDKQKIVDIYEGKNYITIKDKFFKYAKRYKDYEGLVYEIKFIIPYCNFLFKDKNYIGFTHRTVDIRFRDHIDEALRQWFLNNINKRKKDLAKLNKAIIAALEDKGYNIGDLYNYLQDKNIGEKIKLLQKLVKELKNNCFEINILELHKNERIARNREEELIESRNTILDGLNEKKGGGGGENYIPLPMYDIAIMIAFGLSQKQLREILYKQYKIIVSRQLIQERIIEIFNSWEKIQERFLKPIVEALLYDGFEYCGIYKVLNNIHGSKSWLIKWWAGNKELDFNFWLKDKKFELNKIKHIIENDKITYYGIPRYQWRKWILDHVKRKKISKITGLSFKPINNVFRDKFGGRNNYLKEYRKFKTIELLEKGWKFKDIYEKALRFSNYDKGGYTFFRNLFNMKVKEIREKLHHCEI